MHHLRPIAEAHRNNGAALGLFPTPSRRYMPIRQLDKIRIRCPRLTVKQRELWFLHQIAQNLNTYYPVS